MMRNRAVLLLSMTLASGCIFGSGASNNDENNTIIGAPDSGVGVDGGGADPLEPLEAQVEQDCDVTPLIPMEFDALEAGSIIAATPTSPAPATGDDRFLVAWASSTEGGGVVRGGRFNPSRNTSTLLAQAPLPDVGPGTEIFDVTVSERPGDSAVDALPTAIVLVFTSEGLFQCVLGSLDASSGCESSPINLEAADAGIYPLRNFSIGFAFVEDVLSLDVSYFVSERKRETTSQIGAFFLNGLSDTSGTLQFGESLEITATGEHVYAPQLTLGVTDDADGRPFLSVLEPTPDGPRPVILRTAGDSSYERSARGDGWEMTGKELVAQDTFAFASRMRLVGSFTQQELRISPGNSEAAFGYISAAAGEPGALILNAASGPRFLVDLGSPIERVETRPNVYPESGADSLPLVSILAGPNRDRLFLGTWDLDDELALVDVLEGSGVTGVYRVGLPPLMFLNRAAVVVQHEGGAGLLSIENIGNTRTLCTN